MTRHRHDTNHKSLCAVAEALGWLVEDTSQSEIGYDAIFTKGGRTVRVEIKNGLLPMSAQKLTPHEVKVHATLKAHGVIVEILTCADDVVALDRPAPHRGIG